MKFNRNESLTDICNSALAMVGETRYIDNIEDENNQLAVILRMVAYQVCQEVQSHEFTAWDELCVDERLVLRRETKAGGTLRGRYQYNIPVHMIAAQECYDEESGKPIPYEISGGFLHCGKPDGVRLRYIKFSFVPSEWSPELKSCVIKLLSARVQASVVKDYAAARQAEKDFWENDYLRWTVSKKNKNVRRTRPGDDGELTRTYLRERGGFSDEY